MFEFISPEIMTGFFQVVLIDLVLAGDNAIVIGLAAGWKMWRELCASSAMSIAAKEACEAVGGINIEDKPQETLAQATSQIIAADVSMSLDNVLAVAGAARDHPVVLIFGLALSVAMMGVAASFIARLLQSYRWISYVGLAIIFYIAADMIFRGTLDIMEVAIA